MALKVRIGGGWDDILTPKVRVGGSWVTPSAVKVRVGGSWQEVWTSGPTLALTSLSSVDSRTSGTAQAGIRALRNGNIQEIISGAWTSQNSSTEWCDSSDSTVGDDYEVMLVKSSGTTPSGPSLSTYHDINTTRQWTLSTTGILRTFNGTLYIREKADTSNVVSASVSMSVEVGFL